MDPVEGSKHTQTHMETKLTMTVAFQTKEKKTGLGDDMGTTGQALRGRKEAILTATLILN